MNDNERALSGVTVWVTRPEGQGEALCARIEAMGGRAVSFPTLAIESLYDAGIRRRLQEAASDCDDFIFVSRNAVRCALDLLPGLKETLNNKRVFAAGAATREALVAAGVEAVVHTDSTRASEALLDLAALSEKRIKNRRLAVIRGEGGREQLPETLQRRGGEVRRVELYRRTLPEVPPDRIDALWQDTRPDVIVITSATGLDNLVRLTPPAYRPHLMATPLVVIGERVKAAARRLGFAAEPSVAAAASEAELARAVATRYGADMNE